jgi:hypothetical protein
VILPLGSRYKFLNLIVRYPSPNDENHLSPYEAHDLINHLSPYEKRDERIRKIQDYLREFADSADEKMGWTKRLATPGLDLASMSEFDLKQQRLRDASLNAKDLCSKVAEDFDCKNGNIKGRNFAKDYKSRKSSQD